MNTWIVTEKNKYFIDSICTIAYTIGEFDFVKDRKWFWKISQILKDEVKWKIIVFINVKI